MPWRAAAVNVDVDSLYLYYRLHGLDEARATNAVWERGVTRFAELFAELGVKGTFFVVAADLERWPVAADLARQLAADGHELASHTHTHPYALTRLDRAGIADEVDRAAALLGEVRGTPITGFRAPGYNMTDAVFDVLKERGYGYSSSVFPCPPYYLAKLAVLAKMRLLREKSEAIMGEPRVLWAPRGPHRRRGVLEIPITVLPGLRFPFIGTSLLMMGQRGYGLVRPWLERTDLVNLEFHGIDLCDLEADGIDRALLRQPDLRVPLADKLALFRRVIGDLKAGWGVRTLEDLSGRYAAAA